MKQRLINYLTRNLLNAVVVDDLITEDKKGIIYLGGKVITLNELRQLQAEAKALVGFRLWSVITNTPKKLAQDKIFNKSLNFNDVTYGRALLFTLDLQEKVVRLLKDKK